MPLQTIHRYTSHARHKTVASFRSVFSHKHSKSSPDFLVNFSQQSFVTSEYDTDRLSEVPGGDGRAKINHQERIYDAFGGDSSEDEGYVTANDDNREFDDRDSDNSSTEAEDVGRTPDGMQEGSSNDHGQKWDLPPKSNGNHNGLEISEWRPVSELRDIVIDAESEERLKQVDDVTLLRFLKARKMDVAKASDMFIKDWRWRNEFAPKGWISEDAIPRQLGAEKAYLQGIDKKGRPLLICVAAKHFSKGRDLEEFKRFCYYCIEKVIASMPNGMDQFVTIFDTGNTGYRNMDTSASLLMTDFLQAHYPERLGKLFLIHVSSLFYGAYKLVEPAIDANTRSKIVFVEKDMALVLREEIGEECLPRAYGGKADFIPIQYAVINNDSYPCRAVRSH